MTGRGHKIEGVQLPGRAVGACGPSGCLLGVVAGLAQAGTVVFARRAACVMWGDVVVVPNRGVAVRRSAPSVSEIDQRGQGFWESPRGRLHGSDGTGTGFAVQPA